MNAITYSFKCVGCRSAFSAPEVPDHSYGLFVLRTESTGEAAFLDAFGDRAFLESIDMVKEHQLVQKLDAAMRGKLQQMVFSVTCDPSSSGAMFIIGLSPKCPTCGGRDIERWEPLLPVQEWVLPFVEHKGWSARTATERKALIDEAVRLYLAKT